MFDADIRDELRQAVRLHRGGNTDAAQDMMRRLLRQHPNNADAWYAASLIVESKSRQRQMLERALSFDPNHGPALSAMEKLGGAAPSAAGKRKKQGGGNSTMLIAVGVGVLVLAVLVGGGVFVASNRSNNNAAPDTRVLPTVATPAPTNTIGPTSTPLPTETPTVSPTPPPFGLTATVQLFDSQTQQANLYALGTAAAMP